MLSSLRDRWRTELSGTTMHASVHIDKFSAPYLALDLNNHVCDAQALFRHAIVFTLFEDTFKGFPGSCQKRYSLFFWVIRRLLKPHGSFSFPIND